MRNRSLVLWREFQALVSQSKWAKYLSQECVIERDYSCIFDIFSYNISQVTIGIKFEL